MSRRTLIEIEQGRTTGSLPTWHALGHAFDVPLGGLFVALCDGHTPPAARVGRGRLLPPADHPNRC
ncbi:hypothetical protein [Streptomyces sp. NPDC085540]|uniref:hypothetical protein n=1 Tax=Streptomyces sp. NPDC085540 TaxID=3365730 RepID=UPI0037CD3DFC